ncbi:putative Ig domain-containing protein [Lepagella muris]|jgi:alpha-galactosidase|uniref:Alpha-galactosidase n=1 Tax=Lepagella muris TaxID=3032870 RepID=A0AC61RIS9_9BACT|nr:putative Ig domain-containing protein [Lepagella muris]ROT08757.1 alpha-galactosidase [Muribaculaceae bacterium Isolate-037 (Harlan)]TGY79945.1 alpha-galactosidase [Lepagella muris]THG53183.1 alpha-galactosidase [Bacteroidales bacterium]TKC64931.1 alpha-galactosidase [Bacteroidales bacterium]
MKRIFISALGVALIPLAGMGQCPAERDTLPKIDNSKYILTPPAPATPRINGAKVFGARPGSKFLYRVPCTGERPMKFSASGLPKGLSIDPEKGLITGVVKKPGEYPVEITASNSKGTTTRLLTIKIGDEVALTPPLGWSSWNCWGLLIDEGLVRETAASMVDNDLINYGWSYVNIDDGWQGLRGGKHNAIQPNPEKFTDMKKLADELHSEGMRLGIYSAPWVGTYAGFIGSYSDNPEGRYEWTVRDSLPSLQEAWPARYYNWRNGKHSFVANDVKQWEDWGIDYLKYDWTPNQLYYVKEMIDALRSTDRDILFGMSNAAHWGDAPQWARYPNCYRTTGDIRDTWGNMSRIGFQQQDKWAPFNVPGHWADADMMVIGVVGWDGELHHSRLTPDEQYTHVSLWTILASPMFLGCDMQQLDDFTLSLLRNNEIIEVHQDELGYQGFPFFKDNRSVVYAKPLVDGSMAVGLFNYGDTPLDMVISPSDFGIRGQQKIRDLWRQKDVWEKEAKEKFTANVAPHGVVMIKIYPGNNRGEEPDGKVY